MESGETKDPVPPKRPSLIQNWISYFGLLIAACSIVGVLSLLFLDYLGQFSSPYVGLFSYLLAPLFVVGGLGIALLGVIIEWWRQRKGAAGKARFPRLDLNEPRHRKIFVGGALTAFVLVFASAFGGYKTYHYTESVQFCGQTCHEPMEPEFVTYQHSPHARISCVECHVGSGADHYVRSKLAGVHQLIAVATDKVPRPIPTPVANMRPAQDTCENCHWPQKFHGWVERHNQHFQADESNTPFTVRLLLNLGSGDPTRGDIGGIHWHMNLANKVEYIATDPQRQKIPWIRMTAPDGKVTIYESEDGKLTPEQIAAATPRVMDCMDCHNRPAHQFQSPVAAVNVALASGRISTKIPFIKEQAVTALTREYKTKDEARRGIAATLNEFYNAKYPDFVKENGALLRKAIEGVQHIYSLNFFPEMKTDWRAHPDNIGHTQSIGCHRCHGGKHADVNKKIISNDCNLCHTILAQGKGEELEKLNAKGHEFNHPGEVGELGLWKEMNCTDCHKGTLVK
jgi:hypothetical protein